MSRMHEKVDVLAETIACERIRALDETRLNLELSRAGLNPEGLAQRINAGLTLDASATHASVPYQASELHSQAHVAMATGPACKPAEATSSPPFQLGGSIKFFDARRGYGFFVADGEQGDVLVHIQHLRIAGYQTAYEGARVHAVVHRTEKGLQVLHVLSMDQSSAIHPSQLPQRTREKVQAESEWVRAVVKWYNREKGYGFISEREGSPDALIHADTLRRWGVAPLWPKQVVEIRWGVASKGRMVAEIRYPAGLSGLPLMH